MTTTVKVIHEGPDHKDVIVQAVDVPTNKVTLSKHLTTGEEVEFNVYDSQCIVVREIAKVNVAHPAARTQTPS